LPKISNKLNVPIRHHDFGQAVQFDDMIKENDISTRDASEVLKYEMK